MTGKDLAKARRAIGWSRREMARQWGECTESSLRGMESGAFKVNPKLEAWIGQLAAAHKQIKPPPTRRARDKKLTIRHLSASEETAIQDMYLRGMSSTQIGKELGLYPGRVQSVLKSKGVPLRTRGEGARLRHKYEIGAKE